MDDVIDRASVESGPDLRPFALDAADDLGYDPVAVALERWLRGMEEALARARSQAVISSSAQTVRQLRAVASTPSNRSARSASFDVPKPSGVCR